VTELDPPLTITSPAIEPELLPDDTNTDPVAPDTEEPDTKLRAPLDAPVPVTDELATVTAPVEPELLDPLLISTEPPSPESD
jgi:hypothetical protein